MLQPIEMLNAMREPLSLSEQAITLQQVKLLEALTLSAKNSDVVAIFAHGADALRVIQVNNCSCDWAVQTWSFFLQEWVTQKTYHWENKKKAIELAENWYPPMSEEAAMNKWSSADNLQTIDVLFSGSERLAEFLYDTKAIKWAKGNPWPIMTLVASTVIEFKGILVSDFSFQQYAVKQKIEIENFEKKIISIIEQLSQKKCD